MIIANKYKILSSIGDGSFGQIYKGENIRTQELVAIKMELISGQTNTLKYETKVYQYLGNITGFPQVKWFGIIGEYYYMVLTLLGDSLSSIKKRWTFSLADVISIGIQMTKRLEYIHSKGLIHRDIKPDNFLMDRCNATLHLIDFGFCKKYLQNNKHIPLKLNKIPMGTPNFISVNVHNGIEPSRRDDLESVGYIMIYLLNKHLDWENTVDLQKIKEMKLNITNLMDSCVIKDYILYCRKLEFNESPNYNYLLDILNR